MATSNLCSNCKKIPRSIFVPQNIEDISRRRRERFSNDDLCSEPWIHELYPSGQDLANGATEGCELCRLIMKSQDLMALGRSYSVSCSTGRVLITSGGIDDPEIIEILSEGNRHWDTLAKLVFTTVPNSWCPSFEAIFSVDIARKWLTDCDEAHLLCREARDGQEFVPPRLIDLAPGNKESYTSRLQFANNLQGKRIEYAALSYCWGTSMPEAVKTTSGNVVARFRDGLPEPILPRTLKDAFEFTRALGLRYLWIDVLCILQDSDRDWQSNASKMGLIYKSAYCSLAADAAKNTATGLPSYNIKNKLSNDDLIIDFSSRSGQPFDLICVSVCGWDRLRDPPIPGSSEPLHLRSWTLQERHLSHRMIHFSSNDLLWECTQGRSSTRLPWFPWSPHTPQSRRLLDGDKEGLESHLQNGGWDNIITDYSRRGLTYEKDIYTAISGLAAAVDAKLSCSDQYLAGLWRSTLPLSLCWWAMFSENIIVEPPESAGRAPSWSWASIYGSPCQWFSLRRVQRVIASLVRASAKASLDRQLGLAYNGRLVLKGTPRVLSVQTCLREGQRGEGPFSQYNAVLRESSSSEHCLGTAVLDAQTTTVETSTPEPPQELVCLPIALIKVILPLSFVPKDIWLLSRDVLDPAATDTGDAEHVLGLLLRPTDIPGEHHRVGLFRYADPAVFEGCEERELIVV